MSPRGKTGTFLNQERAPANALERIMSARSQISAKIPVARSGQGFARGCQWVPYGREDESHYKKRGGMRGVKYRTLFNPRETRSSRHG